MDNDIVTDEWGSFLSGYAPIKNSRGEFLVGLDMRADKVRNKSENLRISGFLSLLASVALAFLFAKYLAARFTGPIRLVIDRCAAIAAGNLEQRTINVRTGDELDQLLNAFNHMSTTLSLAEQKKQSVHALPAVQGRTGDSGSAADAELMRSQQLCIEMPKALLPEGAARSSHGRPPDRLFNVAP